MLFEGRTAEQERILRLARRPYLARNVATGLGLFGFVAAVYSYSMFAVKQEDFGDITVPDVPAGADASKPSPS
ncbi:hypothetical protein IWQ60_009803 [Tieghemiomyces parasiticus]|uniref:Cytochrome c oxidase assembly factor 3 n=1 Tax=Tieghemiomyces parasiticus TaxID=78921 RepID=A0A9W7ZLU5_9FUNG|nr:hypothetical protein IWQ60_009803 [Tieghemiomyces parasiticus]